MSGDPETYRNRCAGSGEKATDLACRGNLLSTPTNCSATNLPSGVNTWMRLFPRSQTYTSPSSEIIRSWTGDANCCRTSDTPTHGIEAGFARGGRSSSSSGLLPYAPHMRLNLPVSASYTITRLLPYPSEANSSFVLGYTRRPVPPLRTSVALLPVCPLLPMAITNLPALVNLRIWLSLGRCAGLFLSPSAFPITHTNPL